MPTRRDALKVAAGGFVTLAWPCRADDSRPGKALFVYVQNMKLAKETIPRAIVSVDPDRDVWSVVTSDLGGPSARISPDGKKIAFVKAKEDGVWTTGVDGEDQPLRVCEFSGKPAWSSDGKELLVSERGKGTWRISANGLKKEKLPIPDDDLVLDWSNNGEWLLVDSLRDKPEIISNANQDVYTVRLDNTRETRLTRSTAQLVCWKHRFAADSKSVLYFHVEIPQENMVDNCTLHKVGIDGKDDRLLVPEGVDEAPFEGCYSPDGKRIAVILFDRSRVTPDAKKNDVIRDCSLQIVDADGQNGRTLSMPSVSVMWILNWR